MRVIGLLVLTAVLHAAVFAQKTPDPEAGNKRAVAVAPTRPGISVQPHRSPPDATSVSKSGSSSARDLAKIERTSVQQMKTTHKANVKTASSALPASQHQTGNKPINFSYHAPQAADKTSVKNPAPPPVRSHPTH